MEQRKEFLEAAMRGEHSFTELCRRFGISRKNGYKWLNRYRIELAFPDGKMSFANRSRRPHSSPTAISAEVEAAIVELRKQRPHLGGQEAATSQEADEKHVRGRVETQRPCQTSQEADEKHGTDQIHGDGSRRGTLAPVHHRAEPLRGSFCAAIRAES